uniref:Uncharacterized protein n=1 Tax=Setaria digitata TaxID=48799 RepID=A0A915PK63_9BILA
MDEGIWENCDQFLVWARHQKIVPFRERVLLWRVKNYKRMGQNADQVIDEAGQLVLVKRKEAFGTMGPAVLEVLFDENPFGQLIATLKEANTELVRGFLSDLRYLLVSEADVNMADITFLISNATLLTAFSYRSRKNGTGDEDFERLFPALSDAQIRLIDLNGSCSQKEIELVIKKLNIGLVRFHRYPGIDVKVFENTKAINSAVEFVVAQGVHPNADNSGMRFLKHLRNVFPAMKNLYWDWSMMMPTLTHVNDEVRACLDQLVQLYKEMQMNLLAILFFMSSEGSDEVITQIWSYLETFNLPNASMNKIFRDDKPHYHPPYMLFLAGTSEKIGRLERIICDNRIVEPDLRHFLYVQNRTIQVHNPDNTYEFMGFDWKKA